MLLTLLSCCVQLNALELQEKVAEAIRQVDDKLNFSDTIQHEDNLLKLYRETMLQCYNFGFEVCVWVCPWW